MVQKRYCVMCRKVKEGFFAKFPLDERRCRAWVQLSGDPDLVHVPIEKLHSLRFLCGIHLKKKDFTKTGKFLKKSAIPNLHLPKKPLTEEQLYEFPFHVYSAATHAASEIKCPKPSTSQEQEAICSLIDITQTTSGNVCPTPSTSQQQESVPSTSLKMNLRRISEQATHAASEIKCPMPSTSQEQEAICSLKDITQTTSGNVCPTPSTSQQQESVPSTSLKMNLRRISEQDLSSTERFLLDELRKTKCSLRTLRRNAKKLEKLESPVLKELLAMALKNNKRAPSGRRWSTKYKISCLAIFKRSPKTYRYLTKVLPVPSVKTVQNLLKKLPLRPGINKQVLNSLKKAKQLKGNDKLCCLLFDEMALKKRLVYNVAEDVIDGYVDMGNNERSPILADHALVFMLQGIKKKYKQPLAFYFVKGTVSSNTLANIILQIIKEVTECGFTILATVCDQGPTNMGALKILKSFISEPEVENNYFQVNDKKVFIIYDVPHLFKSFRNNFQNYGLVKYDNKVGKWDHLVLVEQKNRDLLYLSKITPNHVDPKYRAKMRVKYAAQILSNTVAAVLKLLSMSSDSKEDLMQTALIIESLDKLFDSTNGPSGPKDVKKGIRENVSEKTNHLELWAHYRKILQTVVFYNSRGMTAKNVRCIEGYLITLRSLRDIWNKVKNKGFKFLNLRQLNQDALENLFGVIRQHNPTDKHPTVTMFVAALKTSIISGLTSPNNQGFNCQGDNNKLLFNFNKEVFDGSPQNFEEQDLTKENYMSDDGDEVLFNIPDDDEEATIVNFIDSVKDQATVYIAGYIARRVLKKQKCKLCEHLLCISEPDSSTMYAYIKLREWWPEKSLTYPTVGLCSYVAQAVKIFETDILPAFHIQNIKTLFVTMLMSKCDSCFFTCAHKTILQNINNLIALMLIRRQCKIVNIDFAAAEEKIADISKKAQQGV